MSPILETENQRRFYAKYQYVQFELKNLNNWKEKISFSDVKSHSFCFPLIAYFNH